VKPEDDCCFFEILVEAGVLTDVNEELSDPKVNVFSAKLSGQNVSKDFRKMSLSLKRENC
jgi:hypothetical protein